MLVLCTSQALSQTFDIRWSDSILIPKITFVQHFSSPDGSKFYTAYYDKKTTEMHIRTYAPDLSIQNEVVPLKGLEGYVYCAYSFAGTDDVFHLMAAAGKNRESADVQPLSQQKTTANETANAPFKMSDWIYYHIVTLSPNRQYLLIKNSELKKSEKLITHHYKVLNTTDASLRHQGSFDVGQLTDTYEDAYVDDQGNACFLVKRGMGYRPKDRDQKPSMELLLFNGEGKQQTRTLNPMLMLSSFVDIVGAKGQTYITGMTYLSGEIDFASQEIRDIKTALVNDLFPKGKLDENDRMAYRMKSLHYKSNGNMVFTAEQTKYFVNSTSGATGAHYFDMAAIEITPAFKQVRVHRVPKYQFSADEHHSFVSTLVNDNLYMLYTDRQTNTTILNDQEVRFTAGKSAKNGLFAIIIRKDGQMEKKLIYGYDTHGREPFLPKSYALAPGKILLSGKDALGILEIRE